MVSDGICDVEKACISKHFLALGDSKGFPEMCKAIVDFLSIVLGIYGFLIPAVIGRQDKFNKKFWETVDKKRFSKDVCLYDRIPLAFFDFLLL